MPFLKSEVTLAVFQSFGYIPMRTDFKNIKVREVAMILAAIFNNLLGIISRPLAFFSSIFDKTYSEFAGKTNDQWALNKTQDWHRQQEYLVLILAQRL